MASLLYFVNVECSACAHKFTLPIDVRRVSTGGELGVLRLHPTGELLLDFISLTEPPEVCPNCGESFS
jgi:hypothetical protein